MSTLHLLDEELRPIAEMIPSGDITRDNLPKMREQGAAMAVLSDLSDSDVSRKEIIVRHGDVDVPCLLYRPESISASRAAYLHIHGGGYISGSAKASDVANAALCARLGITVCSVDYRLAPEHPIPAPLDDCYAALAWLHDNAGALDIDPDRIAVGGESAGGGLAAAVTIRARDEGRYPICHQQLTYPMLDNLTGTDAKPGDPLVGEFVWTRRRNQFGWESYLGDAAPVAPQVPARVNDYAGLPPAWLLTVGLDLFRDENIDYGRALMAAGVPVDLIVYPGACHAFQALPETRLSRRFWNDYLAGLAHGLGVSVDASEA